MKFEALGLGRKRRSPEEYPPGTVVKSRKTGSIYITVVDESFDMNYVCLFNGPTGSQKVGQASSISLDCESINCKLVEVEK